MRKVEWMKWLIVIVAAVMFTACGGGDTVLTDQQKALDLIVTYAEDNSSTRPTADDYQKAGIDLNGVDADEFSDYLALLHTGGLSKADIEKIADDWGILIVDTDGDGTPDGIDTDDDGDGVLDTDDAFPLDAAESVDTDGDGIGNNADTDDDGDGVLDTDDAFPLDAAESVDTDGDGIGNNADTDDDGDGISDTDEEAAGTDPRDPNSKPEIPFVFKVKTDNPGYGEEDTQYQVYAMGAADGTYQYDVDCNYDGTFDATAEDQTSSYLCDYDSAGTYTIAIRGTYPRLRFGQSSPEKLISIEQWGTQAWTDLNYAFYRCKNMTLHTSDKPDLTLVNDLTSMFSGAEKFNGDIGDWNVSTIITMENMFHGAHAFNQDLNRWDVSAVTNMEQMFRYNHVFNGNIRDWNTSTVTNMRGMFESTREFDQDISGWDTSNVTDMRYLFAWTRKFDQDISGWDTGNVTHMEYMFAGASAFHDHDLSGWSVDKVSNHDNFSGGWGDGNVEPVWP